MSGNILVVDDEKIVRDFFLDIAQSLGGNIETAEDGDVALEKCRRHHYDIVFLDMRMPHMNGLETCRSILSLDPGAKVVMMSGYSDDRLMEEAMSCGAMAKIAKPFDLKMILNLIEGAVRRLSGGRSGGGGAPHCAFSRG
jgi:DNA-binding NtrC family response regulator